MNIRQLIREAIGEHRFETGTITSEANQLIMFAENEKAAYDFVMAHPSDKQAIFEFCWNLYQKMHGSLVGGNGDKETIMYDFMANYELPEEIRDQVREAYSAKHNANIYFRTFSDAVQHAKETAEKKGFLVDEHDWFNRISSGPGKPVVGETFSTSIGLTFNGKITNKTLNIQVYGMKNSFELTHYVA